MALASIHLKMQTHWFNGVRMLDSEGDELVTSLIENIEKKLPNLETDDPKQITTIPFYDIAYEAIFPDLEEQVGSKVAKVTNRLHVLKDLFGLKTLRSIHDIKNQSFFTTTGVFPELNRKVTALEAKKIDYLHFIRPEKKFILGEPSRIICDRDAKKVYFAHQIQKQLPNYLRTHSWKLIFDRFEDGTSLT